MQPVYMVHGSKNTLFSISCLLLLLLYAPPFSVAFYKAHRSEKRGSLWLARVVIGRILQAWDGSVTSLTGLWWPFPTKTIKPIRNEVFVASSGDIITDNNDLYCTSRRVKITTTNNKHYFRQLKTRIWIVSSRNVLTGCESESSDCPF